MLSLIFFIQAFCGDQKRFLGQGNKGRKIDHLIYFTLSSC